MKKIIAKINFSANGKFYIEGDEIKNLTYEQIVKLNELGFIEPLDLKDLVVIQKELNDVKNKKEERL